jgi:hypothetical protein
MPKVTITLNEEQMLSVLNRDLRIPGRAENVVEFNDSFQTLYSLLIDLEPVHDYGTAFGFACFARAVFGPKFDLKYVEDPEDYAVLENFLAATSNFDMFSFDWVDD